MGKIEGLKKRFARRLSRAIPTRFTRRCYFETMEQRQMLAVDILPLEVGAVYLEDAGGQDIVGDVFHVTFQGGAEGTRLTRLEINLDKAEGEDCIFDTAPTSPGVYGSVPFSVVESSGIDTTKMTYSVTDGGKLLVLTFADFEAGDKFVFTLDVDEQVGTDLSAVAEGIEFQNSIFTAKFEAEHFYAITGSDVFLDQFSDALTDSTLDLPPEDYNQTATNGEPLPLYTAGAIFDVQQEPLPISISGYVYEDLDMDNQFDSAESGLGGVKVTLYELVDNQYVDSGHWTLTDGTGYYEFVGEELELSPGTSYQVRESQPLDYLSVGAQAGTVDSSTRGDVLNENTITNVVLAGGENSINNNFGEVRPASISGHVYHDANDDGSFDEENGETGIFGAKITVQRVTDSGSSDEIPDDEFPDDEEWDTWDILDDEPIIVYTDSDGFWSVTGLMPGEYRVTEVTPLGYYDGKDTAGSSGGNAQDDLIDGFSLDPNEAATDYNFGELLAGGISGYVYVDTDNDGQFDSTETPIPGAMVTLLDQNGATVATQNTGANGYYEFTNLKPGSYSVVESQPTGYYDGKDTPGSAGGNASVNDRITSIPIASNMYATDYNFGELLAGGISGHVYADDDNDGDFDSTESPIPGVTVTLVDKNGATVATKTTDANGYYEFTNLAPNTTYSVIESQPSGYADGKDTPGSAGGNASVNDRITSIPIGSGDYETDYDFGELRLGSLAGRVFVDYDADNKLDFNERALSGVVVRLFNEDGDKVAETKTDADGNYSFNGLVPGIYTIVEVQPTGLQDGKDWAGTLGGTVSNDRIAQISVEPGENGTGYNFTELELGTISGYVFQDGPVVTLGMEDPVPDPATIRDGLRNSSDKPIAGVVMILGDGSGVALLDSNGDMITTTTDANGFYKFTGLLPGVYTVLQQHPDGYIDSIDTAGTAGGIAVNPKDNLSPETLSVLAVDPNDDAIIQIVIKPGQEATSYNFSEIRVQRQPDYPPPPERFTKEKIIERPTPPGSSSVPTPMPKYLPHYREVLSSFSGGGLIVDNTWHLSVIDGGMPRRALDAVEIVSMADSNPYFNPVSWSGRKLDGSRWLIANKRGEIDFEAIFGLEGAIPVTGDWDGDGHDQLGVFIAGYWFLDLNGNGIWDEGDLWIRLGDEGDQPVAGDWDGDGKTDIGIFGRIWKEDPRAIAAEPGLPSAKNEMVGRYKNLPPAPEEAPEKLRNMKRTADGAIRSDLIDHVFKFGMAGDRAISGDFNGDGIATIGVFRAGNWYLDVDGNGQWSEGDQFISFGQKGDLPVIGDFNGDGIDEIGVFRKGEWLIDSNGNHEVDAQDKVFELGEEGDLPVAGDFNGDGTDEAGVYRSTLPSQHAYHTDPGTVTQ